ncbi:MAG TPA: DUF350 domain-containing protein [Thermosulfurimonas dismutans]|uniref:DUF350 domain-containing protein n=1 Tax=Thermosulfurimonas dismutans TaxID=999894 RepID=A0A7C3CET7_9BACT|nr:DUF350 domain-containing protein [Thermosulfurimonas dismutans]
MNFVIYAGVKLFTLFLLMLAGGVFLKALDRLIFPEIDFAAELERENGAVAIVVAAAIVAWAVALALVLG